MEYYKNKPFVSCHEFGVYSFKRRELAKAATSEYSVHGTKGVDTHSAGLSEGVAKNIQPSKLKDRVQNISHKVDTMNINDNGNCNSVNRHSVDSLNNTVLDDTKYKCKNPVSTQQKQLEVDCEDGLPYGEKDQTQGDTLNQIKAMRRRHSRQTLGPDQW